MLTELHLENFKAWRELKIELGKITALFGENSSGKSSLLQFLLMLKQTKNAVDRGLVLDFGGGPTELVDLGNYGATVHRDPTTETDLPDMQWSLTWRLPARRRIPFRPNPRERSNRVLADDKVRLTARVGAPGRSGTAVGGEAPGVRVRGHDVRDKAKKATGNSSLRHRTRSFSEHAPRRPRFLGRPTARSRRNAAPSGPVKTHLFPSEARLVSPQLYRAVGRFETWYEDLMDQIFYLGPVRDSPRREYRWSGAAGKVSATAASTRLMRFCLLQARMHERMGWGSSQACVHRRGHSSSKHPRQGQQVPCRCRLGARRSAERY